MTKPNAEAGPSSISLGSGPTPYHDSSQFRHWRFSDSQLRELRQALNEKAHDVTVRNTELEKQAQMSLGHDFTDPPQPTMYLAVDEELLLLRHYCSQASRIVREGFQLPESLESTAVSYLKRFYLKNSVMEWHPKVIMPTSVYLAAKTTNYPIPMSNFQERFAKLNPQEILDHEFLVAQSLSFEFWVRGPDKALRGWSLDFQSKPDANVKAIQEALPIAFKHLAASRLTDAEFLFSPSQIGLACYRMADSDLVDSFLDWRYAEDHTGEDPPYGIARQRLSTIIRDVETMIKDGAVELDLKKIKGIDKRLKSCTNPEKVPGTALYIKRKQEQEAASAASKAEKTVKLRQAMSEAEMVFGDIIRPVDKKGSKPITPPNSLNTDRNIYDAHAGRGGRGTESGVQVTGMGVKDEAMGMLTGGTGLKEVGKVEDRG